MNGNMQAEVVLVQSMSPLCECPEGLVNENKKSATGFFNISSLLWFPFVNMPNGHLQ